MNKLSLIYLLAYFFFFLSCEAQLRAFLLEGLTNERSVDKFVLVQNRGIYMFRLDERRVVDATLSGGLARYINHSCQPNCVAETVEVDRHVRIIIFAKRRIARGEEVG